MAIVRCFKVNRCVNKVAAIMTDRLANFNLKDLMHFFYITSNNRYVFVANAS